MHSEPRRIIALLLLFVTITGLVMSFGEGILCAGELPGAHGAAQTSHEYDPAQLHDSTCPCAPSPSHSPNDHFCIGDCGCPCHAPLPSLSITFSYTRTFTYLYHPEPFRHIPEVYLTLFVPPDSASA